MKNKLQKTIILSVIAASLSAQTMCYAIDFIPNAVNKMFPENKFDTLLQIRKVFNEITVLHKMCSEESPGGIVKVINDCSDVFPSTVTDLSTDDKLKLGTSLLGKTINTMTEMETAVSNMKSNNGGGQESSGSGGATSSRNTSKGSESTGYVSSVAAPADSETGEKLKYDFADLKDAEWAREAVYTLSNKEIISGYVDGDFRPNNNITREEFVKLIVCAFKLNTFGSGNSFADVPQGHWAETYISSASRSGIVGGIGNGEFGLGQNITRQDMAVIIYNALEVTGKSEAFELRAPFSDAESIAGYARNAVNALKAYEILNGYTDGTFLPQNNATRAEAAQLIF